MYQVAVIGAGQLGSRHLQGLKVAASPLSITVVDSSQESLTVAKERYESVSAIGEKEAFFTDDINNLPSSLDFAVVATGSKPRAAIVRTLLNHSVVSNLILEKVLFTKLDDYDEIEVLLKEKGVRCWVNCPRRMFGSYQLIKNSLSCSEPIKMEYKGTPWGLCCNALHFIDAFLYITGEDSYSLDTTGIEPVIISSKRNGYIEMDGTLSIITPKGNTLILTSSQSLQKTAVVDIKNGLKRISLNEATGELTIDGKTVKVATPFQSQMTGLLADMLLSTGYCPLSPYDVSALYHRTFIKEMLIKYNSLTNIESDILPVT